MAVRDRETILCISAYRRCISFRYVDLFHTITDNCSCLLYIKAGPDIAPVISSVQCHFFPAFIFSCIKLHLDILRTLSILVVCIIPNLSYCYTRFFILRFFTVSYCIIYNITSNNFHISFNFRNSIWEFSSIFYCCSLNICNFSNFICTCR